MIRLGAIVFVAAWIPLLVAGFVLGMDNPIGLGLLAVLGSAIGLALCVIGLFVRLYRYAYGGAADGGA